jgi:hypothetical protein
LPLIPAQTRREPRDQRTTPRPLEVPVYLLHQAHVADHPAAILF